MDPDELRVLVTRKLDKEKLKAARYGIGVDPQVSMDIEDYETILRLLRAKNDMEIYTYLKRVDITGEINYYDRAE